VNKFILLFFLFAATKAEAQTSALAIADSLYAVGNYSEAIQELEVISEKSIGVHLKLARTYEAAGKTSAALQSYAFVVEEDPGQVLASLRYAKLLKKSGQLPKADSLFRTLTERYPENASFQYELGLVKEKLRDSSAISYFSRTIFLDNTHQQAHFKVAKDLLSKRRFAEAEFWAKRGLEANPHYVSLLSILAQALYHQDKYPEAIEQFEKLVQLGEGSEFVHSKLGAAWAKSRKFEKAIQEYQNALDYEDKNHVTHYSLGKLFAHTGDYRNSETHLLMAILLKDQLMDAEFFSLGLTYKLAEDHKKALEYFEKALKENPNNERAMYERAIAADSYYEDLETRLNFYQAYLNRFKEVGSKNLIHLAKRRIKDLREEMHLAE
jgi:tetratricopeptide (TPR) repeat protein